MVLPITICFDGGTDRRRGLKHHCRKGVRVQVPLEAPTEVLYTDLLFQLPLISHQVASVKMIDSMWLAAKDLSKLNEGEEKERVHTIVGCLFRQPQLISSLRDLLSEVKLHHRLVKVVQE